MIKEFRGAAQLERDSVARHTLVAGAVVLLGFALLAYGWQTQQFLHVIGYLLATWTAAFAVDVFCQYRLRRFDPLEVRRPGLELALVAISTVLAFTALALRSGRFTDGQSSEQLLHLCKSLLLALFLFPVALAVTFVVLRYSPSQLGFRLQGVGAALVTVPILAMSALVFAPEALQWATVSRELSPSEMIFTGIVMAALPEEFWRTLAQTRLGAFLRDNAWGWFLPSIIWSGFHLPLTFWELLTPLPIGLLWGYLTFRTKSFLPAIIGHGTNLWGLQAM